MAFLEKFLVVKKSSLPGAGKGLFARVDIKKGARIVEYKGEIVTWSQVEKMADDRNGYVFYFNNRYCIDAWKTKKSVAHFANDALGIVRVPGIKNNAEYVTQKKRCYIEAMRDIPKGSEILVGYGGDYWRAIRYNVRLEQKNNATKTAELPHHKAAKRTKGLTKNQASFTAK
ncbi:MAG: SET domain-containing protein [Bacteroidetes bacterium]|nr:SET domain-containing protein [Bacteroidota bacterium]